jgi:hypothetical protein
MTDATNMEAQVDSRSSIQRRVDMAKMKTAKFKKLQRQVNSKLKNLVIPAGEDRTEYIAKTLGPLLSYSYVGTVGAIGRTSTGEYRVEFQMGNTGYESDWPVWAYNVALSALSSGKQLFLIVSNQIPFGDYLLWVEILA